MSREVLAGHPAAERSLQHTSQPRRWKSLLHLASVPGPCVNEITHTLPARNIYSLHQIWPCGQACRWTDGQGGLNTVKVFSFMISHTDVNCCRCYNGLNMFLCLSKAMLEVQLTFLCQVTTWTIMNHHGPLRFLWWCKNRMTASLISATICWWWSDDCL